jgi:hypothetical protein
LFPASASNLVTISSSRQPSNGSDTHHQQQPASQPDDTGKEYCYVPEGKEE